MSWYDYPNIFDIIYSNGTVKEANFLEEVKNKHCMSAGNNLLEPACGSGRLLREFCRRGYNTIGFDNNLSMVKYSRSFINYPKERYKIKLQDMRNFSYDCSIDFAYCLFGTFRYLLNDSDAKKHLKCIKYSLKKGGIYILGYHITDYAFDSYNGERLVIETNGIKYSCDIKCWTPNRTTRLQKYRSRIKVVHNDDNWKHDTVWYFRTYGPLQASKILNSVTGLELIAMYNYDYNVKRPCKLLDERLDRIFVLRKI